MKEATATDKCPFHGPQTLEERIRQYSIYQPWLQDDPIPVFDEMREHAPIVRSEEFGGYWILTRYEDVEWAARNPEIFSNAQVGIPHREIFPAKQIPVQLDGDEHRKWRQALSDLFNPGVVNQITPQLRQATIDTIEPLVEKGRCDFIEDVAVKLPAEAFLINFGIGREYLQSLQDHKNWLRREALPKARNDEDIREANKPLWQFFSDAIDRRRAEGTEGRIDVLSRLLNTSYDGRPLTQDEMVNAAFVTMLAALDTTTAALGLIFQYLARHPEAQDMITRQPDRIPQMIEELLRHEPVVSTGRLVTQDVERHGVTMRKGDRVLLSWGMAGLDPNVFEDPDRVDFDRPTSRHLAFAVGPHRCLGMFVARRVMKVAVEEWHARIPRYSIAAGTTPVRHYSPARGLRSLELTYP
ncbi:cytochrome P450 [Dactylosporangium sp. NBC_01737]|uniref:cytochrome P450 n=1 Tax=Dactylosporangium sp. NBC_01737 TaxID=2975959 RepID=UPI002E143678|nr:cytochrome P450 [Dactylosporangium sp. NBC_01737]